MELVTNALQHARRRFPPGRRRGERFRHGDTKARREDAAAGRRQLADQAHECDVLSGALRRSEDQLDGKGVAVAMNPG